MSKATQFLKGARLGMPIALGYIPVSFSFGMLAVQNGIPAWAAIVISMTNLTSAGHFAGMNFRRRRYVGNGNYDICDKSSIYAYVAFPVTKNR